MHANTRHTSGKMENTFTSYKTKACSASYKTAVTQLHATLVMNSFFMLWKRMSRVMGSCVGFSECFSFAEVGHNLRWWRKSSLWKYLFMTVAEIECKEEKQSAHYLWVPIIYVNVYTTLASIKIRAIDVD